MNKLNYRLINILLIIVIIGLIYMIKGLWTGLINIIIQSLFPFFVAFIIAYTLYPLCLKLRQKNIPSIISILIVGIFTLGIIGLILLLTADLFYKQILLFISNITIFFANISQKYSIDIAALELSWTTITKSIIKQLSSIASGGFISILNQGLSFVTKSIIVFASTLYFLLDMDKIRKYTKDSLLLYHQNIYNYLKLIDNELRKYIRGMGLNIIIQTIEYTSIFLLIGHPNYLILGIISGISTLIPWFGGLIVTILALLISSVISMKLFILTSLVCLICPQIDGYIISVKIYGKTNRLPPLIIIFSVFAGGVVGGLWGIILSVPCVIIILTSYKYFKKDIRKKLGIIKNRI